MNPEFQRFKINMTVNAAEHNNIIKHQRHSSLWTSSIIPGMHAYRAFARLRRDECISQITVCGLFTLQLWEVLPQVSLETAMARAQCSCTLAVNASEGDVLVVCLSAVIEKQTLCVFCNARIPYPRLKTWCHIHLLIHWNGSIGYQSLRHMWIHMALGFLHVTPFSIALATG